MKTNPRSQTLANRWRPVAHLALLIILLNPALVLAQAAVPETVTLAAGDSIRLSVPGRPDLTQDFVLDDSGQVKIDPVGLVALADLSLEEATQVLKRKLRLYYPTLDAINLELINTGSVRIYVIGAVSGRVVLNFASEPTVWDVIREMGGPGVGANLNGARIIREEDGIPTVYPIDLSGTMTGDDVPMFVMKNGDTLIIPAAQEGIPNVDPADGVKVFGSVGVPTIVPITEGTRLMAVLMLAGAPTQEADKSKIFWIHNDGVRSKATIVDLNVFLLTGDELGNPLVYPGDTINVEFKKPSWARGTLPFILGSLAAVATIWLAYDNIVND